MDCFSQFEILRSWGLAIAKQLRLQRAWDYLATPLGSLTVLAIVTLACGALVERFTLVLSGITALVLILGITWPLVMVVGLRATLEFDRTRTPEGRTIEVTVRVTNRWPLPVWGLGLYGLTDIALEPAVSLRVLRPWSAETFKWSFTAPCRGIYPAGRLHLATSFPFGLVRGRRSVSCPRILSVSPQPFPLDADFGAGGEVPWDRGSRLRSSGGHGDMVGLRPYQVGDTMRRIHWAQTAKYQQIVVCEREAFVRPAVEMSVDLSPASHRGFGPGSSLEWSLRVAVSICQAVVTAGGNARCVIGGRTFDLDGQPRQWQLFLDFLAGIPRQGFTGAQVLRSTQLPSCWRILITSDATASQVNGRTLPQHSMLIVFQSCAFAEGLAPQMLGSKPEAALPASACIVLDRPDRVPAQLARGLQMEIGRC